MAFVESDPDVLEEVEVLCSGVILEEDLVLTTATCCDSERRKCLLLTKMCNCNYFVFLSRNLQPWREASRAASRAPLPSRGRPTWASWTCPLQHKWQPSKAPSSTATGRASDPSRKTTSAWPSSRKGRSSTWAPGTRWGRSSWSADHRYPS